MSVRPSAPTGLSPGGPWAGAGPRLTGMRRRKVGSSGKSSGAAGWLMAAICRQSVLRSPRDRSLDRSSASDCLASSVACAGVCLSVRSVWAGTDARAPFVSAFSRTDWTDGQMLFFVLLFPVFALTALLSRDLSGPSMTGGTRQIGEACRVCSVCSCWADWQGADHRGVRRNPCGRTIPSRSVGFRFLSPSGRASPPGDCASCRSLP